MNKYESVVKSIASQQGGNREKKILKNPHTIKKGETWNREHKVLNILEIEAEADGYRNGFQIDIVTKIHLWITRLCEYKKTSSIVRQSSLKAAEL